MIEKILENENCGLIITIAGMAAVFAINELGKASKAAMENGYDMSASFKDCGEVCIKRNSGKEEKEDESATEENMIGGETDVTV